MHHILTTNLANNTNRMVYCSFRDKAIMRRNLAFQFLLMCFVLVATSKVFAELTPIPTGIGWRQGVPLKLLDKDSVKQDLGLNSESIDKLIRLTKAMHLELTSRMAGKPAPPQVVATYRREIQDNHRQEIEQLLSLAQRKRLDQIHLQLGRLEVLSDPAVADELRLTEEQRGRIRSAHQTFQRTEAKLVKNRTVDITSARTQRDEAIINTLTSEQKSALEELKGEPLDEQGYLASIDLDGKPLATACLAFSPDGNSLASTHGNRVIFWNPLSAERLRDWKAHDSMVTSLAFSPDGLELASAGTDRFIKFWESDTGAELRKVRLRDNAVRAIAYSPDGGRFAVAGGDRCASMKPTDGGFGSEAFFPPEQVWSVAFSNQPNRSECGLGNGRISAYRTKGSAQGGAVLSIKFSPDFAKIATASSDGSIMIRDTKEYNELHSWMAHSGAVRCLSFSPDGLTIASSDDDGHVRLWDVASAKELLVLDELKQSVPCLAFHPDGSQLATVSADWVVRLWTVDSGALRATLNPNHAGK